MQNAIFETFLTFISKGINIMFNDILLLSPCYPHPLLKLEVLTMLMTCIFFKGFCRVFLTPYDPTSLSSRPLQLLTKQSGWLGSCFQSAL